MWRNYDEDWERRKSYLIRSLFQDIPVLSPVPEGRESRYGDNSLIDRVPSRPHSPLPPLIIERMPNRHDHPEHFYRELEQKMKKLYRRLFNGASCSSVEDLIETYDGNIEVASILDQFKDYQALTFETDANIDISVDNKERRIPTIEFESASEKLTTEEDENDRESDSSTDSNRSSLEDARQSQSLESSTQSLYVTQLTVVADVHGISGQRHVEDSSDEDATFVLSPILASKRNIENVLSLPDNVEEENETSERIQTFEEMNENSEPVEIEYSDAELASDIENPERNSTNKSIELMRRQRQTSPCLGSLPRDLVDADSSGLSVTYTDIEFQNKMSLEKGDQYQAAVREMSISRETVSISTISSPSFYEERRRRFSGEARRRREVSYQESPVIDVKRKKSENIAIQTSISSDTENVNWNQLKSNFFVGIPKIYKLCSCKDHSC